MESKRSESTASAVEAFRNTGDFYHAVFDNIEDYAVFAVDKNGMIISWNTGAQNILGYSEDEILNKNSAILFTETDVERGENIKELKTALKHGRAVDERFHVRKNGSRFWGSGKVFPVYDNQNNHIGFTKIMRNQTDRMRAEERLQRARQYAEGIIEWAAEPIMMLYDDLTISTANKALFDHYKLKKTNNLKVHFNEFANGEFNSPEFMKLIKELNEAGHVYNVELAHEFKQSGKRILLVNGRKLTPDNNINLLMLSIQDITEQRSLEQQKEDFISIASHEIRTPLTVIKATAQMLQRRFEGVENGAVQKSAAKINEKTDKLLTLIGYLLDSSQLARSEMVMKPEHFSINELVVESVEELRLISPDLSIITQGKVKDKMWGDRFRISQVLNILLNNAIKYSPVGKDIIVKVAKNKTGDKIVVSVQDFGIGIPKEEQANLFKRFWRASTAKSKNIAGIGLGLYISSQIIKSHNGKLWFTSDKNKGSTFKFSIPLKAV